MPVPTRRQDFGPESSTHIEALRRFLISKGYFLQPHGGTMGPQLRSALKNWSSGVNHRNPNQWNRDHPVRMDMKPGSAPTVDANMNVPQNRPTKPINPGDTSHQDRAEAAASRTAGAKNLPKHNLRPNDPKGMPHMGGPTGGPGAGPVDFSTMLAGLLGKSNTAKMMPLSLADQAASPYTSQAATFQDQINRLPNAKKQALQNISDWFGQVGKAEKRGAANDQKLADAGSAAMQDAAKGIMASLGGSAMAGSGEVGAMGANDANTLTAMGANDAALANELAPIFAAQEASAKNTRSQQYDNQLSDLQDQMGQAKGQADAARAAAVMQILQSNNSARQTNFGNASGLLNTLAGLQISGMNAASEAQSRQIENALRLSEIQKNGAKSAGGLDAFTPSQRAGLASALNGMLMDPNSGKLKSGMDWPTALQDVRNYIRTQGLNPFNRQVINQFIAPTLANAGIKFQNPNALYRP